MNQHITAVLNLVGVNNLEAMSQARQNWRKAANDLQSAIWDTLYEVAYAHEMKWANQEAVARQELANLLA